MELLTIVTGPYSAVVVLSQRPLKQALTTSPFLRVTPSWRKVRVVPSRTARPVVPGTSKAVRVVPDSGRTAPTE